MDNRDVLHSSGTDEESGWDVVFLLHWGYHTEQPLNASGADPKTSSHVLGVQYPFPGTGATMLHIILNPKNRKISKRRGILPPLDCRQGVVDPPDQIRGIMELSPLLKAKYSTFRPSQTSFPRTSSS